MSRKLSGQSVVVTGASSGIGRDIAQCMAKEGANVTVATRHEEPRRGGTPTVELIEEEGGEAQFVRTDVLSLDDIHNAVDQAVEAYGSLDVMVNNAGVFMTEAIEDVTEEEYDKTMDVNLKGTFFGCQAAIDVMNDQPDGGVIINLSSTAGPYGQDNMSAYCASKSGIAGLTRQLACEKGPDGIRVNAIQPGLIETAMTESMSPEMAEEIPLQRIGDPEDVGPVAVFLASTDSGYINGHSIVVDGGVTLLEFPNP